MEIPSNLDFTMYNKFIRDAFEIKQYYKVGPIYCNTKHLQSK